MGDTFWHGSSEFVNFFFFFFNKRGGTAKNSACLRLWLCSASREVAYSPYVVALTKYPRWLRAPFPALRARYPS